MQYCVVSKNREGEVYSVSPPQSKEQCEAQKNTLEAYMVDHSHKVVPEEIGKQYIEKI